MNATNCDLLWLFTTKTWKLFCLIVTGKKPIWWKDIKLNLQCLIDSMSGGGQQNRFPLLFLLLLSEPSPNQMHFLWWGWYAKHMRIVQAQVLCRLCILGCSIPNTYMEFGRGWPRTGCRLTPLTLASPISLLT